MRRFRFLAVSVLLAGLAALPRPASAAFLFCNNSKNPIEAAFAYREDADFLSEGWWQIQPGQCARVYNKPLTQRYYFYFAHVLAPIKDGKKPISWGGKYAFCTDSKAFRIEGDSECEARGYKSQGFQEVDMGTSQRDYTLTFLDEPGR